PDMNTASARVGGSPNNDGTLSGPGTLTVAPGSPTITYTGLNTGATISTTPLNLGNSAGTTTSTAADGAAANDLTISSVLADGTGSHGLTKSGNGVLHLTGTNSFTGALNITSGTLSVSSINSTVAAS